ncbi:GNAT family N-acetyltransferase [Neobacillus drentensis]|uniref:GNAT family N-acetyltransferase n=1 Tax=Neobacillus drentensis TaxID=220684 RepID=UPI002FFFCB20
MGVRKAVPTDLIQIATIHKEQFKDHFLGHYSNKVIRKYYEPFLESCVFLVSESEGKLNGFIMGGLSSDLDEAKSVFLANNMARYIIETLLTPSVYRQAMKRLNLLKLLKPTTGEKGKQQWRLLSIAVSENAKGTGISSKLVKEFEANIDFAEYGLSVHTNNSRAIHFYIKNGFKKTHEKGETTFLIKDLENINKKRA